MKYVVATVTLVLIGLSVGGWELMWHAGRVRIGEGATSPDGRYVAQFFSLPEGSVAPYGHGAYVRHRHVPLWAVSTLVFWGYCAPNERLYWRKAKELVVQCKPTEGTPKLLTAPAGLQVTHQEGG